MAWRNHAHGGTGSDGIATPFSAMVPVACAMNLIWGQRLKRQGEKFEARCSLCRSDMRQRCSAVIRREASGTDEARREGEGIFCV